MDSMAFLDDSTLEIAPIYVLQGDEDFLKRQVLVALRERVFSKQTDDVGYSCQAGDKATLSDVVDELETLPFLCARRLVVVESADSFVTKYRAALEKYLGKPAKAGILVLDVRSWTATTRLAKMIDDDQTIVCKSPPAYKMHDWCVRWARSRHGKQLSAPAARHLVDLVGTEMGVLDQEIAKLAIYAGDATRIDVREVDELVGSSRSANVFAILDAFAEGRKQDAMRVLEQLFEQGEDPIRILGAFSVQLRRLVQVTRLSQQGCSFVEAADQAGVPPFGRASCEKQLRHLQRNRVDRIYTWLMEADQGIKGGSELAPRQILERLLVRLA